MLEPGHYIIKYVDQNRNCYTVLINVELGEFVTEQTILKKLRPDISKQILSCKAKILKISRYSIEVL